MKKMTRNRKPLKTFEEQIVRNDKSGCLEWTGSVVRGGYGYIIRKRKKIMAHRYWYELHVGPIQPGEVLCHRCDNPRCIEPKHLFIGSQAENISDKVRKSRQARGEKIATAILTAEQVVALRQEYAEGARQVDLASKYGIHQTSVSLIVRRKNWPHIP